MIYDIVISDQAEFMVPGPNVASVVAQPNFFSQIKLHIKPSQSNCSRQDP